jgi:DNA-binding transcriptional ArsR family regulator
LVSNIEKADLIIHPVRLRILRILGENSLTTAELSDRMPDVPKSSLYRHIHKLSDAGMLTVAEVKNVKGTEEKVYHCVVPPTITPQEAEAMSSEDHLRYFSAYAATLIQGFKRYLDTRDTPDFVQDRVGYSEVYFYASNDELDELIAPLSQGIMKLSQNGPTEGRKFRKLVVINHPEIEEKKDDNQ